jgi:hypothetical protein
MYHVKLSPSQTFSGTDSNEQLDFSVSALPDQGTPFFITCFNEGPNGIYLVDTGETVSGIHCAAGQTVTAGPFLKADAENVEIRCDGTAAGTVSFLSVMQER